MTIKEYIIENTIKAMTSRMAKLEEIQAPKVMIVGLQVELERLEEGILECGGKTELLDEELSTVEQRKGKGGQIYYMFNGYINYFPKALYGRYVNVSSRVKKMD